MSDTKLPLFRGTKPTVENYCATCGTVSTAGCWRRGWSVDDESVNLCNKCGLQFKNGKLDKSGGERLSLDPDVEGSPPVSKESSIQDPSEPVGPYVCYSMERQADEGAARRVLFYVHDAEGNEKLALTGYDSRGTGHFSYESVEGFEPGLKCRNRTLVLAWLKDMGASRAIDRPGEAANPNASKKFSRIPPRPTFSKEYSDFRQDSGKDGEIDFENFYLVDAEGHDRIAICGTSQGDCSQYRCVLQDLDLTFDDRAEALGWLEWVIGKATSPPYRFLRKEPRKPIRARDSYTSSLAESGITKKRMSSVLIEDMEAVFGDSCLMRWVLRKPSPEEIERFHQWRKKLTEGGLNSDKDCNQQSLQELLDLLHLIQRSETCLKLLEDVAAIAKEITKSWNTLTTRALEKASEARKRNAIS